VVVRCCTGVAPQFKIYQDFCFCKKSKELNIKIKTQMFYEKFNLSIACCNLCAGLSLLKIPYCALIQWEMVGCI